MFFSLDDSHEEVFGVDITFKERLKVACDVKKIRKIYRKQRGLINAIRLRPRKVLFGFNMYQSCCVNSPKSSMELWDEFVYYCKEEGADFLDNLI